MTPHRVLPASSSAHTPTPSVIKTRMQSLEAKKEYRNALHCAYRIATEEGILKFWKGTVPRLGRLVVSCARVPCHAVVTDPPCPDERRHRLLCVRKGVSPCRERRAIGGVALPRI